MGECTACQNVDDTLEVFQTRTWTSSLSVVENGNFVCDMDASFHREYWGNSAILHIPIIDWMCA